MDTKKQDELEKLYALRAGLSIISQKSDELDTASRQLSQLHSDTFSRKKPEYKGLTTANVESEIADIRKNGDSINDGCIVKLMDTYNNFKDRSKVFFVLIRNHLKDVCDWMLDIVSDMADTNITVLLVGSLICYILFVPLTLLFIALDIIAFPFVLINPARIKRRSFVKAVSRDKNFAKIRSLSANISYADTFFNRATIDGMVDLLTQAGYKLSKLDNKLINKYLMLSPSAIMRMQALIDECVKVKRQEGNEEIRKQKAEYQKTCEEWREGQDKREREYQHKAVGNEELSLQLCAQSNAITNALKTSYSSVLDMRDWENLDLVIYYYETGRADSIKEALQLVDTERRNNNLINCIKQASCEISDNIRTGFSELGKAMIHGFQSLSAQIEAQRVQTIDALNGLNSNVSEKFIEVADGLDKAITQQQLSNALLEKANVSSKELVEQMKKLNTKVK